MPISKYLTRDAATVRAADKLLQRHNGDSHAALAIVKARLKRATVAGSMQILNRMHLRILERT